MEIVNKAIEALNYSYSPYSKFKVGCAILLKNGKYILGSNIENVSYPLSCCAERVTIFKAISEGYKKEDIVSLAIVADTIDVISPCGACRQVMQELLMPDTKIILSNLKGSILETTPEKLLPLAFKSLK